MLLVAFDLVVVVLRLQPSSDAELATSPPAAARPILADAQGSKVLPRVYRARTVAAGWHATRMGSQR